MHVLTYFSVFNKCKLLQSIQTENDVTIVLMSGEFKT